MVKKMPWFCPKDAVVLPKRCCGFTQNMLWFFEQVALIYSFHQIIGLDMSFSNKEFLCDKVYNFCVRDSSEKPGVG